MGHCFVKLGKMDKARYSKYFVFVSQTLAVFEQITYKAQQYHQKLVKWPVAAPTRLLCIVPQWYSVEHAEYAEKSCDLNEMSASSVVHVFFFVYLFVIIDK